MVTIRDRGDDHHIGRHASHVALALDGIEVPTGSQANHHCDNRLCVNTAHLLIGSQGENIMDMVDKDRHALGERHTISKLTDDAVRDIRENYSMGARYFADRYNVKISTIYAAKNGQNWRHVE